MGMIYQWARTVPGIDAQVAGEELERIRTRHNGRLEADMVVEASKKPTAPLHAAFEWDDKKAAQGFRLDQARYIIRSVTVQIDEQAESDPVRAFVSVVRDDDRSYTSTAHALSDPELRQQVLQKALRELEAWQQRYAELVELASVFAAIDQARPAE